MRHYLYRIYTGGEGSVSDRRPPKKISKIFAKPLDKRAKA